MRHGAMTLRLNSEANARSDLRLNTEANARSDLRRFASSQQTPQSPTVQVSKVVSATVGLVLTVVSATVGLVLMSLWESISRCER
jgi:hypothetical protein